MLILVQICLHRWYERWIFMAVMWVDEEHSCPRLFSGEQTWVREEHSYPQLIDAWTGSLGGVEHSFCGLMEWAWLGEEHSCLWLCGDRSWVVVHGSLVVVDGPGLRWNTVFHSYPAVNNGVGQGRSTVVCGYPAMDNSCAKAGQYHYGWVQLQGGFVLITYTCCRAFRMYAKSISPISLWSTPTCCRAFHMYTKSILPISLWSTPTCCRAFHMYTKSILPISLWSTPTCCRVFRMYTKSILPISLWSTPDAMSGQLQCGQLK